MRDVDKLATELQDTERLMAEGRAQVARLRKIIFQLAQSGADPAQAVADMRGLLDSQRLHERRHQRILGDIAKARKDK